VVGPEDYQPGRQLTVGWLGDRAHGVAKWQFGIHAGGRCIVFLQVPVADLKWSHSRMRILDIRLEPARAATLLDAAINLPKRYPEESLGSDRICVDHSGHDGGVHRLRGGDDLCLAITVQDRGQIVASYYMTERSHAWVDSELRIAVRELLAPALTAQQMGVVLEAAASTGTLREVASNSESRKGNRRLRHRNRL
jgi:hypothetical protein